MNHPSQLGHESPAGAMPRLERALIRAERAVLVCLISAMLLLAFLQVVFRTCFASGFLWADTLLRHLVLWAGFLGAALAAGSDQQFAFDALARLAPGRARIFAQTSCHVFAMGVSALLAHASARFFLDGFAHPKALFTILGLGLPTWIFELILPFGFGLLAVHYALKAVAAARQGT